MMVEKKEQMMAASKVEKRVVLKASLLVGSLADLSAESRDLYSVA